MPAHSTLKGWTHTNQESSLPSVDTTQLADHQYSPVISSSQLLDEDKVNSGRLDHLLPSLSSPDYRPLVCLWEQVRVECPLLYDGAVSSDVDSLSSLIQLADWLADWFSKKLARLEGGGRPGFREPRKLPELTRLRAWILVTIRKQVEKDLGVAKPRRGRAAQKTDKKKRTARPEDERLRIKLTMYTTALRLVQTWSSLLRKRKDSLVSQVVQDDESSRMDPSTVFANSKLFDSSEQQASIVEQDHSPSASPATATPPSPARDRSPALALSLDPASIAPASPVLSAPIPMVTYSPSAETSLPQTQDDYGEFGPITDFLDPLAYWDSSDYTEPLAALLPAPNTMATYYPSDETPLPPIQDDYGDLDAFTGFLNPMAQAYLNSFEPTQPLMALLSAPIAVAPVPPPSLARVSPDLASTAPASPLFSAPITTATYSPSADTPLAQIQDESGNIDYVTDFLNSSAYWDSFESTQPLAPLLPPAITMAPVPSSSLAHSLNLASTAPASPLLPAPSTMAAYSPFAETPLYQNQDDNGDFDTLTDFMNPLAYLDSFESAQPLEAILPAPITMAPVPSPSLARSPDPAWTAPASPVIPAPITMATYSPSVETPLLQIEDDDRGYNTFMDFMDPLAYWNSFMST
ncbi:uncharacterized protein STEHIDRAFT_157747 [Stereum hirsutum FP-91666 SS1]|uniref:uncharacterized protein n=1 Tax=Stereum hirsutum (strain FP-91666) TaxID=721885 RepID=UPI00044496F2|nr:uncharacterized protein STEHIDRAFT_157747 [Stereum hirsutum FP-91666 SS1]EIM86244.1 hypothetical protein STEHIDRAFT_157747 [Stereum hirsutum FP-91666 SS1]